MRRTLLAISAAVALLAGACGASRPQAAPTSTVATVPLPATSDPATTQAVQATVPPRSTTDPSTTVVPTTVVPTTVVPTTTSTTLPVTTSIPAKITAGYVDAVLAKLNHVYGNAVRATVAAHRLTPAAISDLSAIYSVKLGAEEQKIFVEDVREGLGDIRKNPGDRVSRVTKLLSAGATCIYARIRTNYDAVDINHQTMPADEYVELNRKGSHRSPLQLNPTPWIYALDLTYGSPTAVSSQCHAG
jgi:hypothetical protein